MSGLVCSRCCAPVAQSYAQGTCHSLDSEPQTMPSHDEAITVAEAFGDDEESAALAQLRFWADRGIGEDRIFEIRYLGGTWCVRIEHDPTGWSHHEDTCTLLTDAARFALQAAEKEGFR